MKQTKKTICNFYHKRNEVHILATVTHTKLYNTHPSFTFLHFFFLCCRNVVQFRHEKVPCLARGPLYNLQHSLGQHLSFKLTNCAMFLSCKCVSYLLLHFRVSLVEASQGSLPNPCYLHLLCNIASLLLRNSLSTECNEMG